MDAIVYAIPLFFILMGAELAWSAWSGRMVYRFNDLVSNMGCGIGSQIVGVFTKTVIFAIYVHAYESYRLFTVPSSVLTWIITFLLVDLLYYWFHRLSHEVNFLWAAHVVHHQSEEYNLSVALRQSWWQGLFSFWFYVPIALLGVHPVTILTVGAFVTLYQFWIHTKAIGHLGPVEALFNTPSHHRVHHGSDPKYIDRNHAGTLIIWDKLFGTFQAEEEEPIYGITTPLDTWDPLRANFRTWAELIHLAERCPRWWDKVQVFVRAPGWRPAELGGPQRPQAKDRAVYRKFDTPVHRPMTAYVSMQFVLLLLITTYFLFNQRALEGWRVWALAGVILVWVMDMGLLLDANRAALWLETLRIGVLAAILLASADLFPAPMLLLGTVPMVLLSLGSLWWADRSVRSLAIPDT